MNVVLLAGDGRGLLELVPLQAELARADLEAKIVYVGGDVDARLRDRAVRELGGSEPDLMLGLQEDAGPAAVAVVVEKFKTYLEEKRPDVLAATGDTDAVMACCLVAAKSDVPIARLDAGRRGAASSAREVNHLIIDRLAGHHFASDPEAMAALLEEGVPKHAATFVGNLLSDVFRRLQDPDRAERLLNVFNLKGQPYATVVLDRSRSRPAVALELLQNVADHVQVLHLVDTRAPEAALPQVPGVRTVDTESLREMLILVERAEIVITDTELIQEAAAYFEVPCLTVGRPISRPVTVTAGCNHAAPFEPFAVGERARALLAAPSDCSRPPFWDGQVSRRIVEVLVRSYGRRLAEWISEYFIEKHRPHSEPAP